MTFHKGQTVLIEAVVQEVHPGNPHGVLHVVVTGSSDPERLIDGVEVLVPDVLAHQVAVAYQDVSGERDQNTDPDEWLDLASYYEGDL